MSAIRTWRLAAVLALLLVPLAALAGAPLASAQDGANPGGWLGRLVARPAQQTAGPTTLVKVRGTGTVPVTPDRAVVTLRVVRAAPTVAEALAANEAAVATVVAGLSAGGVAPDAIEVGSFDLTQDAVAAPGAGTAAGPGGFRVAKTVAIRVDDAAGVAPTVEQALAAGADAVQGVEWSVAAAERYRSAALSAAVAAASADGRALAEALGGRVARVVEVATLDGGTVRSAPAMAELGELAALYPGAAAVSAAVELTLAVTGAELPTVTTPAPARSGAARATAATPAGAAGSGTAQPTVAAPTGSVLAASTPTGAATPTRAATAVTTTTAVAPTATTLGTATRATTSGRAGGAPSATPAAPAGGAAAAGSGDAIPFVAVAQADTGRYRGTRARAIVAASAPDWERLVAPLLPRTMRVSPDYDREVAVAVFLGERPGTGFALKVRKVTAADGRLTVHVDTVEPTGTLDRTSGPTSPFQVITLRRSDLPPDLAEPLPVEVMP